MRSNAEEIKDRLSITEVVSSYLKLEKAGVNLRARCPFHTEKTPSFYVSPNRNTFHCFGCGRGGDIFTFTELIEGMSFSEALIKLAERAGVRIERMSGTKESTGKKKILADINEEATKFFEKNLVQNEEARKYLIGRGLTEESISKWRIGFAPNSWDVLLKHLREKGFKDEDIILSGVVGRTEKGIIDRFRSRIIFPLIDLVGVVVGFSSRIFPADREGPKYVNSPETLLFFKSRFFYGLNFARQEILKKGEVVMVEGQMDLILAHQAGIVNTVAVSGTALTDGHLNLIKRFTNEIIYCFDSDEAGRKAAIRAFKLSFGVELLPKAVVMPSGLDPADMVKDQKDAFIKAVNEPLPAIEWIIKTNKFERGTQSFLSVIKEEVLPVLAKISSNIDKDYSVKMVSDILGVREESVRDDLVKVKDDDFKMPEEISEEKSPPTISEIITDKILGLVLVLKEKDEELVKEVFKKVKEINNFDIEENLKEFDDVEKNNLIFRAEFYAEDEKEQKNMLSQLVENLELDHLTNLFAERTKSLRELESSSSISTEEVLKELTDITNKINNIKIKNINL